MNTSKFLTAGVGERIQYLAHKYNDTTIRFILHYPASLNPDILCAAASTLVSSVDVLHSSFIAGAVEAHWRIQEDYEPADYFTFVECEGDPMKPAQSISLQPIAHESRCQMHVTQIQSCKSCAVIVRISHLVVDGGDGKYLLNKLAEAYRMLEKNGNVDALEIKSGSRSALNVYSELSAKDIFSLFKPPFNDTKTNFPFSDPDVHGMLRMLRTTIPAKTLSLARKQAKADGATVNDLLLTACYRSYAKLTGCTQPMSISAMMDLRQHCKDGTSEGLSNLSGGLPTCLENYEDYSFADMLRDIAAQTKAIKENPLAGLDGLPLMHIASKTIPIWLLLQATDQLYSNMSLSLTNLGNIPCEPLIMGDVKPIGGIFGGPLRRKPFVQIGAASFDGTAELTIVGDFTTEDLPSLNAFLHGMKEEIENYLNCSHIC